MSQGKEVKKKNHPQLQITDLAYHYHLIPRPPEQVIGKKRKKIRIWAILLVDKFKERKEVTEEVTVICPWSQGNLVEEPEVRSKFLGYSHSHCVANGDENDNELNNDFKTWWKTTHFNNSFYQHFFPVPQPGVKYSSHIHTYICLSV